MARLINCNNCKEENTKMTDKYQELYESIPGTAQHIMTCDTCGKTIYKGQECHAGVLLPSKDHFAYRSQEPHVWASNYININENI